jgi:hypothetical protein
MNLIGRPIVWVLLAAGCSPSGGSAGTMDRAATRLDPVAIRKTALVAALRSELRHVTALQEQYFSSHHSYSSSLSGLPGYQPDGGVTSTISGATATGWAATARHSALPGTICSIYVGSAAPPPPGESGMTPSPGEPYCSPAGAHDLVR